VSACIEIETTRDIARQILRHRSFSFQEFSQRYADPTKDLDFVLREARFQDTKNRQNSIEINMQNDDDRRLAFQWEEQQKRVINAAKEAYSWAVEHGIAKEQARAVLPEGNTVSRMYMNGSLRSWIHYIELRAENGTQKEHREIAKAIAQIIAEVFPLANEFVK
jgi:thymidylate synthase (FAD)